MLISALSSLALAVEPATYTPEAAREDLAVAREALERIHPGYVRFADRADLDAVWARLEAEARDGADLTELYLGLSELLADIRCDHTKAELPSAVEASRETDPVYLPFRFELFDGRMFVDAVGEAVPLVRGEEVLALDGDPVAERLASAREFMPVDGFTDHVRDVQLANSGEFLGSGFDQFDALLNPDDSEVVVDVRGLDGAVRRETLTRIGFAEFRSLRGETRWRNFSDEGSVTLDRPAEDVAVLNVETFVNYRTPVSPNRVFSPIFQQLNEEGVETLIVDLRRNGGGSTDAMQGLLSHLTRDTPVQVLTQILVNTYDFDGLRTYIDTWDPAALNPDPSLFTPRPDGRFEVSARADTQLVPFERAEHAFRGRVIILTSRANASGATQLIGVLRDQDHVTLVGEETGGTQEGPTAGIIWFVELPNSGIVVRVPWLFQRSAVADPVIGLGYAPDIEARDTYESWMAGDDPALEAAIASATQD